MTAKFDSYVGQLGKLLEALKASKMTSLTSIKDFPKIGACYALIEDGRYLYIGISKNLQQRMRNHTSGRGEQSVFAFKLARDLANKQNRYTIAESRKALMKDAEFAAAMKQTTLRVKRMGAKYVQIDEPILRYLFEVYATLALEAPFNDFNTH